MGHLPDVIAGDAKAAGDTAKDAMHLTCLFEDRNYSGRIHGEVIPSVYGIQTIPKPIFESTGISVSEPTRLPRWSERILAARKKLLNMNQVQFAEALGTTQSNVSKWEKGVYRPAPDMFVKIAAMLPDVHKLYFLEEAGVPKSFFTGEIGKELPAEMVQAAHVVVQEVFARDSEERKVEIAFIPLLTDAAAAGDPLHINEKDIEQFVPLPKAWLPRSSRLFAVRVDGDSMEPILQDGWIAMIDVTKRDPKKLVGHMAAVRIGDGVTLKWLRKQKEMEHYMLVPQHSSIRHPIIVLNDKMDWQIVGEVVKWIGEPPSIRK